MKLTILGADGFIGSHLKEFFRKNDYDVTSVSRFDVLSKDANLGNVIFAIGLTSDFRDNPLATVEAHVCALKNLLEAGNFESLLYLSSTRLYSNCDSTSETSMLKVDPSNPSDLYNLSKLMGESLCLSGTDKSTKVVRLSNIFGPGSSGDFITELVAQAKTGHLRLRTSLQSEKDYLCVDRLGPIVESIILRGQNRMYNVASGFNTQNQQIVELLQKKYNCTVETAAAAQDWSFKPIDVSLIKDEFAFAVPSFEVEFTRTFLSV